MKQTKKGNNWYFGMKAHITVDADSGLVLMLAGTPASMSDLNVAGALRQGQERDAFADAGFQGVHKREEAAGPTWHVAMRRGLRKKLNPNLELDHLREQIELLKTSVRAQIEHLFRLIKRQFGFAKVRYWGLATNTAQLVTLFALSNLCMARRKLLVNQGWVRLHCKSAPRTPSAEAQTTDFPMRARPSSSASGFVVFHTRRLPRSSDHP